MPSVTDASIPLSFLPTKGLAPDFSPLWEVAHERQQQQEMQQRNALAQQQMAHTAALQAPVNALRTMELQRQLATQKVFSDPTNVDKDGNLTPTGKRQLFQADPQAGMDYQKNELATQQKKLTEQVTNSDLFKQKVELTTDVNGAALERYNEDIKNGVPEPQARANAQKTFTEGMERAKQSGLFSEQEQRQLAPQFDPQRAKDYVTQSKEWTARKQKSAEEGKWEVLTDPGTKDAQGNPIQFRYNPATAQSTTLEGQPYTPTGAAKMGSGTLANEDAIKGTAQMIASYRAPPLTSQAMRGPQGAAIMAEVQKINPDYQAARYPEISRAMTAFGTGRQGDITRSMNVGISHLDTIDEAARALGNHDMRAFNAIKNRFEEEIGRPAPVSFDAMKQIVADEIVKAIVGYSGAVNDRETMQAKLNRANSPEQLMQVTKDFRELMAGQLRGLQKQYEDATGFKEGPFSFQEKLLPQTKRELEGVQRKAAGEPSAKRDEGLPRPKSEAEYKALPPSARYVYTDGSIRTKGQ